MTPPGVPDAAELRDPTIIAQGVAAALGGRTVVTAESCTAGRVATALAGVESAAEFLRGGIVAYQAAVKRGVLGVRSRSVYCEAAVVEMANGACALVGADVAVATSGVAGGDPVDGVPPGTVFVATRAAGETRARTHRFAGSPEEIVAAACRQALGDLVEHLAELGPAPSGSTGCHVARPATSCADRS